ncbi:hypothetical protein Herbaro_20890 [Herbaspirillum sp. WKF16]|jgi:hypothetical protein|uniref:hypothetical protein n=1 Tax=Herbaspirillum sp. WKF16 TaxID=3028312 RepID=UPI0023A97C14|nr:hypothetical protein [Herbaspirillum sp. WKF16]WDZ95905.1 hypothetical protein Herbaro_20890 [Herbaspirillum sp. WKF16]
MISAITQTGQPSYSGGAGTAANGSLSVFQQILQNASQTSAAAAGVSDTLAADLNAALQAAGISAPPAMRIVAGTNGPQLADDPRDATFQAVMAANPTLSARIGARLSAAEIERKAALGSAVTQFAGDHPTNAMADFLLQFAQQSKPQAYSISFNGSGMEVQELGAQGWTPLKNGDDINKDLLAAYTGYMVTHAVTVEKRKDGDDQPAVDFKVKLARVLDGLQGA